jgi:hypothetical protein
MLSRDCRRFREEFTPGPGGSQDPHRQACPACAAYAAAVERAASAPRLPLPERLRSSLRALPKPDEPRLPMPQAQLPAALKDRLRNIPRDVRSGGRRELPVWIRSPRWAIAASYFLTVVLLNTVGDPVALGRRATGTLGPDLDPDLGSDSRGAPAADRERHRRAVRNGCGFPGDDPGELPDHVAFRSPRDHRPDPTFIRQVDR